MLAFLMQLVVQILQALLVDELSERVRRKWTSREGPNRKRVIARVHRRTRERLFNSLRTDSREEP